MDIIVTLGCDKTTTGHVDTKAGIFGVLEERFRGRIPLGRIVPAWNNTDCAHCRTGQCNVDCPRARTGFRISGGYKTSYQRKGLRM